MIPELQRQLHQIANIAISAPAAAVDKSGSLVLQTEEEEKYSTVVGMVYSLVEDGRLNELHEAIKRAFPGYFTS